MVGFEDDFDALLVKVLVLLCMIIWYSGFDPIYREYGLIASLRSKQNPKLIPIQQMSQPSLQNLLPVIAHGCNLAIGQAQHLISGTYFPLIEHILQRKGLKILLVNSLPPPLSFLQTTHKYRAFLPWILIL